MRVKSYLCIIAALSATAGCETGRRLAPPGFFKYEEIAGQTPVNPAIEARKADLANEDAEFPVLSSAPSTKPKAPPRAAQDAEAKELLSARDDLAEAIAADQRAAAAEAAAEVRALEEKREALAKAIEQQRRRAAEERDDRPQ